MKILIALCMMIFAQSAQAYVPPAAWILKQSIKDRSSLGVVEWSAKITELKTQTVFKENLRVDFKGGKIYARYLTPGDEVLGAYVIGFENLQTFGKLWFEALMDPSVNRVRDALSELHVLPDAATEASLERHGKQVTWSWGETARIHFLKDEFYIVGYQTSKDARPDEIFFDTFASTGTQARVPKNVRVRLANVDLFNYELKSVKIGPTSKFTLVPAQSTSPAVREWVSLVR